MPNTPPSEQAIRNAGRTLALGRQLIATMTPRQQAEAAYTPTGPSVDELEARIRKQRGLPSREVVDN
jgi:hypothetical protein